MLPIRTVLYPTDFSESSSFVFRLACALARDYGARLVVVHVAEPIVPIYADGVVIPPRDVDVETNRYEQGFTSSCHGIRRSGWSTG
jgi:nucleotide-binding universal stress UspA family protein